MSGSSSTTRRRGLLESGLAIADAFHERAFQVALAVAAAKRLWAAAKAQLRPVEEGDGRAGAVHPRDHVRSQEERAAFVRQPRKRRFDRHARRWVEPAHRLVEHVKIALEDEA